MPLFKVHVTYDISSKHPHKSNVYAYENQTRDQQKIPANFKSTIQNTSEKQLDKEYWFSLQEGEGREKEECLCYIQACGCKKKKTDEKI